MAYNWFEVWLAWLVSCRRMSFFVCN